MNFDKHACPESFCGERASQPGLADDPDEQMFGSGPRQSLQQMGQFEILEKTVHALGVQPQ